MALPLRERFREELALLVCSGGIYVCYMLYGFYQEKITCTEIDGEKFKYPMFMMLGQCAFNACAAFLLIKALGNKLLPPDPSPERSASRMFNGIAFTYLGGMLASYTSLKFVNFPTMTLGKSCKMLPVMAIGYFFYGKRYPLRSYICMILLAAGVSAYFLLKSSKKLVADEEEADMMQSMIGSLLVLTSLACDGLTGAQEDEWKKYPTPPTPHQLMFGINVWGTVQLFFILLVTGEGITAARFLMAHPVLLPDMFTFFLISAMGQLFIFMTITRFGSLVCSIVTTTRKFFTILASVIYFGHPQSTGQWAAVAMVFFALGWDIVGKQQDRKKNAEKKAE